MPVDPILTARKDAIKIEMQNLLFRKVIDAKKVIHGNLNMSDSSLKYMIEAHNDEYARMQANDQFVTRVNLTGKTVAEIHADISAKHDTIKSASDRLSDVLSVAFDTLTSELASATTNIQVDAITAKLLALNALKYDATDAEIITALA